MDSEWNSGISTIQKLIAYHIAAIICPILAIIFFVIFCIIIHNTILRIWFGILMGIFAILPFLIVLIRSLRNKPEIKKTKYRYNYDINQVEGLEISKRNNSK